MKKHHSIKDVSFDNGHMSLVVDNVFYQVTLSRVSALLARATLKERTCFEISPSGYGIHWPLIDEDLSVDALLKFARVSDRQLAHA
ncbi:MAG: DUF2442 domain-containing protein [Candidatus Omnitrophica bacterium]|nr:DUF2442 domain-containing protein [Candidatus Omnitrophota bacterium]